jgi:predicted RNA-binding Zn-ribbon protein involved in translation (DUF1610 family)
MFNRTYRHGFVIPACPKDEIFSSIWIEDGIDIKKDYSAGISKSEVVNNTFVVPAIDVARDYMQSQDLEREGLWICESGQPMDAELEAAKDKRIAYLTTLVDNGNKTYAKFGARGLDKIEESAKKAAVELGIEDQCDWVVAASRKREECTGCGTQVALLKDGAPPAYCPVCKSILNVERAKKLQEAYAQLNGTDKQ